MLISVVTPSFMQVENIGATLDSVLGQECPNLEYIVVDGGSTDGSVREIVRRESGLARWVSESDSGHANALNKGFAWSTGDVMGWLNSSDLHLPWTLRFVSEIFEAHPDVQWITGVPSHWSDNAGPRSVGGPRLNQYDFAAGHFKWIQQESTFWRRSLWEEAGGFVDEELPYAFDLDLWMRFFEHAPLVYVETILGGYRYHGDRRGGESSYGTQAEEAHRRMRARLDPRSRHLLAAYASMWGGRRGVLRERLSRSVARWDRCPTIRYDFDTLQWTGRY